MAKLSVKKKSHKTGHLSLIMSLPRSNTVTFAVRLAHPLVSWTVAAKSQSTTSLEILHNLPSIIPNSMKPPLLKMILKTTNRTFRRKTQLTQQKNNILMQRNPIEHLKTQRLAIIKLCKNMIRNKNSSRNSKN